MLPFLRLFQHLVECCEDIVHTEQDVSRPLIFLAAAVRVFCALRTGHLVTQLVILIAVVSFHPDEGAFALCCQLIKLLPEVQVFYRAFRFQPFRFQLFSQPSLKARTTYWESLYIFTPVVSLSSAFNP